VLNCKPRVSCLSVMIGLLLTTGTASAQSDQAQDDAQDLDSVRVTGVRASIQKSLVEKHSASGIVDAISAEDIGKFPDLNLSESLQRIPGVTLDRNGVGEGATVNLRGLGPEFTQVEINGMPGLSNGGEGRAGRTEGSRGFNFEMFATELFSKASVYKTGLAEVDEGGLAGTVRLETPRPLDNQGTRMVASILGNYGELTDSLNPRTAVLFSHNHNDIFGIAATVAFAQTDFQGNVIQAGSWRPFADYNTGSIRATDEVRAALVPLSATYYVFNEDRDTTGTTLTLQFRPNDAFSFTLDGLYSKLKNKRLQLRPDFPIDDGGLDAPINAVVEDGVITAIDIMGVQERLGVRHHTNDEDYQQIVMRMEWAANEYWSIRPSIGYSKREAQREFDMFLFRHTLDNGPGRVTYRMRGDFIDFSSSATDFSSDPEDFEFSSFVMNPSSNKDEEKQFRFDVDRHFSGNDHVLKFGLRHNDRTMERIFNEWRLMREAGTPASSLPHLDDMVEWIDFEVSGAQAGTPDKLLSANRRKTWEMFMPGGIPIPGTFVRELPGASAQQTFSVQEKTHSAWMQMDLTFGQWSLIPGIRYLRTEQISSGFDVTDADQPSMQITPVRVSKTYNGYLPSLTARYDLGNNVILRGAYARTLTRPSMGNLSPGEILRITSENGGSVRRGNPNLEPYYANNIDIGAEWYFSAEGLLALNLFYKKAKNFIENQSYEDQRIFPSQTVPDQLNNGTFTVTEPVNGVSATIKGLEVSMQSRFSRLPGAWGNLGGIVNYTHTESSADFSQQGNILNQGLPGLSKNSVNAIVYYDDGRLDTRLSWAWRDRYLANIAENPGGVPRFTKAYGQLDLSLNYRATERISFQAQVLNLTQEQRIDLSTLRYVPFSVTEIDRRFMFGIRVAL